MTPVPDHKRASVAYRAIADVLRNRIRSGTLHPGDRLPGIRALGDEHGVTPQTAALAIRLLAAEGWVTVEAGRATLVSDPLPDAVPTVAQLAADVADLRSRVERLEQRSPE